MKKALILIVIIILAGVVAIGCYSIEKNKLNTQKSSTESAENSNNSTLQNTNSTLNNTQTATNNNISNTENNNSNQNQSQSQSQSGNSNQNTLQNINNQTQNLNISSDFTQDELNILTNLGNSQGIDPEAGTNSIVVNLNYYSVVDGEKYYIEYKNNIAGMNWSMYGGPQTPNKNGNYSGLEFKGYVNDKGQTISQSEFLNGELSFNINNSNNLSNQDKINMIKKIAAIYFNFGGYVETKNGVVVSKNYLETGANNQSLNGEENINMADMSVNLNNTITRNGQTFYALELQANEPFYISLTGMIYVGQEHYLSKPFNIVSETNEQVKKFAKGI